MFSPALYNYSQNRALHGTTSATRTDIYIIQLLDLLSCPSNYSTLYGLLMQDKANTTKATFDRSLKRLTSLHMIYRKEAGNYISYTITAQGKLLLAQYNVALDQIVRELLDKYAVKSRL